jgi:xylan 1,4-beta-xylosidase
MTTPDRSHALAGVLRRRVVSNPIDLTYKFQNLSYEGRGHVLMREGADPSVVLFRDRYYMFVSMSRGFFHSEDLVAWTYHPTDALPGYDHAPDARVIDGAIYVSASKEGENCPLYRSSDPLHDDFVEVAPGTFPFWDPNLFADDDGKVYLYWGCSNTTPIQGVKMNLDTFEPHGEPVPLISADPTRHGWERCGENYKLEPRTEFERSALEVTGGKPFIEGAWMTRVGERYYLQYSAPGTEWNTYADGVYVGSSPLGLFEYSPHSPFSSKPGGFIPGAGHGSTFQDRHGNWWHVATMRISVAHPFERRVGLFPAGLDENGVLFCVQAFGDYPQVIPDGPRNPWEAAVPPWMLLSYRKPVTASSAAEGHAPELAVTEDVRTWWTAASREQGEWLSVDLAGEVEVNAVQVNIADDNLAELVPPAEESVHVGYVNRAIDATAHVTELVVELSRDGVTWEIAHDTRGLGVDGPHPLFVFDEPRVARFLRITAGTLPYDAPFSVSGLRVFGLSRDKAPEQTTAKAERVDELTASVSWTPSARAHGYVVRYGLSSETLYHSWMVYEQTSLELPSLNAGVDYWVAVDSFGESGVTPGEPVPVRRSTEAATPE